MYKHIPAKTYRDFFEDNNTQILNAKLEEIEHYYNSMTYEVKNLDKYSSNSVRITQGYFTTVPRSIAEDFRKEILCSGYFILEEEYDKYKDGITFYVSLFEKE